jgi:hypothetical protein
MGILVELILVYSQFLKYKIADELFPYQSYINDIRNSIIQDVSDFHSEKENSSFTIKKVTTLIDLFKNKTTQQKRTRIANHRILKDCI